MNRMFEKTLISSGIVLLALTLAGCGGDKPNDAAKPGAPTDSAKSAAANPASAKPAAPGAALADPLSVRLTPDMASLVKTGTAQMMEVSETTRIAGRLAVNGYRTARIGAPLSGRIVELRGVLGKEVRAGEVLAEISSPDLTTAQLTFLKAHSAEQLTSRAVERAQLLLAADVIGSAELQRRQSEQTVARAEKRAAADQLRVLGLSAQAVARLESTGQIIASAPITATQAGTVIELKIALGQVVQPADALFVVTDLSSLWATADIPEQDASDVKRGQKVEIEVPALGNEKRTGSIVYVADVVNPETRTVRVGVVLDNPGRSLKPAMLTTMMIESRAAKRQIVPSTAVVRENDADHLFVETSPGVMKLTRVQLGPDQGGKRALTEKFPEGTKLVLDGGFHLNNERQKRNLEKGGAS